MQKKFKIGLTILMIIIILIIIFIINNTQEKLYTNHMFYMDTYIELKIYTKKDQKMVSQLFDKVDQMYKTYHQLTDRYNPYDNIINVYYLNHSLANQTEIMLDQKLYDILKYGIDKYKESKGLVNIALGNLIDVWKPYRDNQTGLPSATELNNIASILIDDIRLTENHSFSKINNVSLDLGALAKGYATEMVGRFIEKDGYPKYILNAGGNVKTGDYYQHGKYKIGIENPTNKNEIYQVIKGTNISVITSGGYERFYTYNGVSYHHIIDAATRYPANNMKSVTVITKDSGYGDFMSTYLFLLPISEGVEVVNKMDNLEAIWYANDGKIYKSKGLSKYE